MTIYAWVLLIIAAFVGAAYLVAYVTARAIASRLRDQGWVVRMESKWNGVELCGAAPDGRLLHFKCVWWKR